MNSIKTRHALLLGVAALGLVAMLATRFTAAPAQAPKSGAGLDIPAPAKAPPGRETATLAAGCFWSMEAIFKQLKGVDRVEPGYSGGNLAHPSYEEVETATTGHAETVNIIFDPKVISYRDLLQVLLTVRDPTTQDRQGNDTGPQYRSVIFFRDEAQHKTALKAIREVDDAHLWRNAIVTAVVPYRVFYRAENYHLDYYNLHPDEGYCAGVIAPEIAEFREKFKSKLK